MFCHITENWRGRPLDSREVVVNLIGNTTTTTGLTIQAKLDEHSYPIGQKISDEELSKVNLQRDRELLDSRREDWPENCQMFYFGLSLRAGKLRIFAKML